MVATQVAHSRPMRQWKLICVFFYWDVDSYTQLTIDPAYEDRKHSSAASTQLNQ